MLRLVRAPLFLLWTVCLAVPAWGEGEDPYVWDWYEVDSGTHQVRINLYIFYRDSCPKCKAGLQFADTLQRQHPWLRVWRYEVSSHSGNIELYRRMASSLNRSGGTVPAV